MVARRLGNAVVQSLKVTGAAVGVVFSFFPLLDMVGIALIELCGPKEDPGQPTEPAPPVHAGLVGAVGKTRSVLNPVGAAIIQNQRVEARSAASEFIKAGVPVKVVDAVGNTVIVERIANSGQEEGES